MENLLQNPYSVLEIIEKSVDRAISRSEEITSSRYEQLTADIQRIENQVKKINNTLYFGNGVLPFTSLIHKSPCINFTDLEKDVQNLASKVEELARIKIPTNSVSESHNDLPQILINYKVQIMWAACGAFLLAVLHWLSFIPGSFFNHLLK